MRTESSEVSETDEVKVSFGHELKRTFESWWETSGQPYEAAVLERGGTPWTDSIEDRRDLWNRRYTRPHPPAQPHLTDDITRIRGEHRAWITDNERTAA